MADYSTTARALALPVDDDEQDDLPERTRSPMWRRGSQGASAGGTRSRIMAKAETLQRQAHTAYRRLSPLQRVLVVLAGITTFVLGILFLVFNERIFEWLVPMAEKWRNTKGGWLILWAATFLVSFPPLIGYSSCITMAGFVYGLPNGWFIVASATVMGSAASFVVSRTILSGYVHRLIARDRRFAALSLTLKHDGLKLLIMVRLCPLPYSLSNGAISTFPTVSLLNFVIATACVTPKLLIPVFVGGRLADIAEKGDQMDAKTKAINICSIVVGILIGVTTGWFIYRQTKRRAIQLEQEERERVGGHAGVGVLPATAGLLDPDYTDDPIERDITGALRQQEIRAKDQVSLNTTDDKTYTDNDAEGLENGNAFKHGHGASK